MLINYLHLQITYHHTISYVSSNFGISFIDAVIVTRDIVSGNAVNFKATHDHAAIYVEEVHEGAHILWLINI